MAFESRVFEYLADCVLEIMQADHIEEALRSKAGITLDIISNDSPSLSAPRSLCSPANTDEIKRFEESARAVFGEIASCTMTWGGR